MISIAQAVIDNGKPYRVMITCEGTSESGPYSLTYRGYRWGQLKVERGPTGNVALLRTGDPHRWAPISSPQIKDQL